MAPLRRRLLVLLASVLAVSGDFLPQDSAKGIALPAAGGTRRLEGSSEDDVVHDTDDSAANKDEYAVSLTQTAGGDALGLDIEGSFGADGSGGGSLTIKKVGDGLVQDWNEDNPGAQVRAGDEIVKVNDVSHDAFAMLSKLRSAEGHLELRIARGAGGGHEGGAHGEESSQADHEEGDHAEGHSEEHHDVDVAVMVTFFGGTVLASLVFWFLRFPDADIRIAAHQMATVAVSIFCAMSIWSMIHAFCEHQVIPSPPPRGLGISQEAPAAVASTCLSFILFVILWISISLLNQWTCTRELRTWFDALKMLVPHLAGFAGLAMVWTMQAELHKVYVHAWSGALVFPVYILILGMKKLTEWLRTLPIGPKLSAEEQHKFEDATEEGEDEAACFIMSGVIFRWATLAFFNLVDCDLLDLDHSVESWLQCHDEWLWIVIYQFMFGILLTLLVFVFSGKVLGVIEGVTLFARFKRSLKMMVGFTLSRVVLYVTLTASSAKIELHVVAEFMTALIVTAIAVGGTILLDSIADHVDQTTTASLQKKNTQLLETDDVDKLSDADGWDEHGAHDAEATPQSAHAIMDAEHVVAASRGFIGVFGLLVGLSWEEVFDKGNKTLVAWIDDQLVRDKIMENPHPVLFQTALTWIVLAVMIPMWAKHIVPDANRSLKYHLARMEQEKKTSRKMFDREIMGMLRSRCCYCCPRFL